MILAYAPIGYVVVMNYCDSEDESHSMEHPIAVKKSDEGGKHANSG
jgi:hypothetical protein